MPNGPKMDGLAVPFICCWSNKLVDGVSTIGELNEGELLPLLLIIGNIFGNRGSGDSPLPFTFIDSPLIPLANILTFVLLVVCGANTLTFPFMALAIIDCADGGVEVGVTLPIVVGVVIRKLFGVFARCRSEVGDTMPVGVGTECVVDGVDTEVAGDTGTCLIFMYGCGDRFGFVCCCKL